VRGEGRDPREREENEGGVGPLLNACGKLFAIAKKFGFDDART
jgi:hypothetical protein